MNNLFLEGAFCVDSRNERHVRIIDVKIRKWFQSIDEITSLKKHIDAKINPLGLSFDQAVSLIVAQGRRHDPRDYPSENIRSFL